MPLEQSQPAVTNSRNRASGRYAHIFFMDGVGLGDADPAQNPFVSARMPYLASLLGDKQWYRRDRGLISSERATLVPTDTTLNVPGRPQSATGQATILTGRNIPQLIGEHYGPKPNAAVATAIHEGTLFQEVAAAGGRAALLTPYPQAYFDAVQSGRRLYSAVPLAVTSAGFPLFSAAQLRAGLAVSPDFTGQGWRDFLGYTDTPVLSLAEAGRRIARRAAEFDFSFFEHWPSDQRGHRGTLAEAVAHLEILDEVLGALAAGWDDERGLLIITSDHGNIEDKSQRQHTRNPVPTIILGTGHGELAKEVHSLADIAGLVRHVLGLQKESWTA